MSIVLYSGNFLHPFKKGVKWPAPRFIACQDWRQHHKPWLFDPTQDCAARGGLNGTTPERYWPGYDYRLYFNELEPDGIPASEWQYVLGILVKEYKEYHQKVQWFQCFRNIKHRRGQRVCCFGVPYYIIPARKWFGDILTVCVQNKCDCTTNNGSITY